MATLVAYMQPIAIHGVVWSVCRSFYLLVSLPVMTVIPAKMAEPIKMPFGLCSWLGWRNCVLDGDPDPHGKGHFWGGWHWDFSTHRQAPFLAALMSGFPCMLLTSIMIGWPQKQSSVT